MFPKAVGQKKAGVGVGVGARGAIFRVEGVTGAYPEGLLLYFRQSEEDLMWSWSSRWPPNTISILMTGKEGDRGRLRPAQTA